jgi:hypothetical protein
MSSRCMSLLPRTTLHSDSEHLVVIKVVEIIMVEVMVIKVTVVEIMVDEFMVVKVKLVVVVVNEIMMIEGHDG